MKSIRLIYCSRPTETFRYTDLAPILRAAAHNNRLLDVNGMLALTNTHFLQVVEGSRSAVSQLYTRLIRDPRHRDVTLYAVQEIEKREFSSWRMGYMSASHLQNLDLEALIGAQKLAPDTLDSDSILVILRRVISRHAIPDAAQAASEFLPQDNIFEVAI